MRRIVSWLCAAALLSMACIPVGAVSTSASSAILMDADSGRVLYEHNADEPRLIASVTKLLTALVAAERGPGLDEVVEVRAEWLSGVEGSSIYLAAGEKIPLRDLLYGEIPSERIAQLLARGREVARRELAATIDQLYARVQPAALAQEAKEEASARFASFKQSASLTLQDAAGGNAEAIKKVGVVALSAVGAIGVIVLLATRSSRRSRREARRAAREAAAHTLAALKSDVTEAL